MTAPGRLSPADEVIEAALSAASAGTETVVVVEERSEADVRFANNTITSNGVRRDRRVCVASVVRAADGARAAVVSASGSPDVTALVAEAERTAAAAPIADDAAPFIAGGAPDADFAQPPRLGDLDVFAPLLADLRGALERGRRAGHVLAGFAAHELATTYLGTSHGVRRRHAQPTGSVELVARAGDGSASSWAARGTPDFSDVALPELEDAVRRRLELAERRIELPAGRYEVLLPPDAVADLVVELAVAASGREAEDGGTVFSAPGGATRLGEAICTHPFTLEGDPARPGLECADAVFAESSGVDQSIFDNGAPVGPTRWIDAGRLARLRYHRAGAARSGQLFTPWVDNLALSLPGAEASLDDLVARTERALLLTCLWYIREVDRTTLLLTGLTRDGVYLVEDGEIVGAVNNFRFNESPLDVLNKVVEAGATTRAFSREWNEWFNRTAMPPLRVADFNMSSVSPAS